MGADPEDADEDAHDRSVILLDLRRTQLQNNCSFAIPLDPVSGYSFLLRLKACSTKTTKSSHLMFRGSIAKLRQLSP